jgi:opacity protein-like surface antigen
MRKLLCGAAAAVCLGAAGPAMANGSMKDVVVVEPAPIWSGCYFGLNVGGAWMDDQNYGDLKKSEFDSDDPSDPYKYHRDNKNTSGYWYPMDEHYSFHDNVDDSGPFGGGHIGCNWERGAFVFGVESDIGVANDVDYLASVRGRIGTAAWSRSHLYLTAGVAFASFDRDFKLKYDHAGYEYYHRHDEGDDETGWVLGAGWEYLIKDNMSFGLEGLYYWFDDDSSKYEWIDKYEHCQCDYYHAYKFDRDVDNEVFVLRARLSYHLRRAPEPLK